jgi:hypothetical protein
MNVRPMYFLNPTTESELEDALSSGLAQESHFLDFKAALDEGKKGSKSLAKDIASFSIDGGIIIVGVAETPNGYALEPIDLPNQSERIDQVALQGIIPPVSVRTTLVPSKAGENKGFLVIQIPASDLAPHMVDGQYMARSDSTQRALTHPEVIRLHERLSSVAQVRSKEIVRQIDRDPVPFDCRIFPHLYMTATPRMANKPIFLNLLRTGTLSNEIRKWLKTSGSMVPRIRDERPNTFDALIGSPALRRDGVALYSGNITPNREFSSADARRPEHIVEVEFSQEGQIRFFNAQVGMYLDTTPPNMTPAINPRWILEQVREFVALTGVVSQDVEFGGRWDFSIAISGVSGMNVLRENAWNSDDFKYEHNTDAYISHSSGDLFSIQNNTGEIIEDLLGRFVRSIGMEEYYKVFFN